VQFQVPAKSQNRTGSILITINKILYNLLYLLAVKWKKAFMTEAIVKVNHDFCGPYQQRMSQLIKDWLLVFVRTLSINAQREVLNRVKRVSE